MKEVVKFSVMGMVKVVQCLICDRPYGCPKKNDIPKFNPCFPKPELGGFKFPDLPIWGKVIR